jgi:hypothetical protein
VIANLLLGGLIGAWLGATWAMRMQTAALYRTLAVLLVVIAVVLLGVVSTDVLVTLLAALPVWSAYRVNQHAGEPAT